MGFCIFMIIIVSKDEDINFNCDKVRKKKINKIFKNFIMNCVVSYDMDGNMVIFKDDEIGDGLIILKCLENKGNVYESGYLVKKEDRNEMVGYNFIENKVVEIELNNFEKIGRFFLINEYDNKMKYI